MKRKMLITSILTAVVLFSGCGSNGNSNNSNGETVSTTLNKGIFTDSPVKNLYYQTSSGITGYTDQNGTFEYKNGDYVTFKMGDLTLGTLKAAPVVTPNSFIPMGSDSNIIITIPLILQNLDTDGNISNGIQLPSPEVLKQISFKDINLSNVATVESNLTVIKQKLKNKFKKYKFPDINLTVAEANYMFSSCFLNYSIFLKESKTSFLVMKNSPIMILKNGKIYINDKLVGNYEVNQTLLSKVKNIFYTSNNPFLNNIEVGGTPNVTSNDIEVGGAPNVTSNDIEVGGAPNVTSNDIEVGGTPNMAPNILDLNISGKNLNVLGGIQLGNVWIGVPGSGDLIYIQTHNLKNAILAYFFLNNSFKTNITQEFYIAEITENNKKDGIINFNKDGNVTLTFNNKKINAYVASDGNVYYENSNVSIFNASQILFDPYNDVLITGNKNALYVIGSNKNSVAKVESFGNNYLSNYLGSLSRTTYTILNPQTTF